MLLHNQYEFDPNADLIGSGGFARVYKAFDINLHRTVALKRFDKKDTKYSVLNEIRRCFDFNHTNIIRYLNCFQVENVNNFGEKEVVEFGVMEYADAGDFSQLIDKKVKVSANEFKEIVIGILNGLQYLHTPNAMHQKPAIIHRDLKASNILFTTIEGKLIPKICDFGISKELGGLSATTATGTGYLGTIEYMAPEQINLAIFGQDGKLQPNTDLWALGCMLYEYFTGKAPFGKRADGDMQINIQNNILDKEPEYSTSIPDTYKKIIQNCLVKNAANRIADANMLKHIIFNDTEIKKIEKEEVVPVLVERPTVERNDEQVSDDIDKKMTKLILVFMIPIILYLIVYKLLPQFNTNKNPETVSEATQATTEVTEAPSEYEFTNRLGESFLYTGESIISIVEGAVNKNPNGKGTAVYNNGDRYEGEFINGLREGTGVYYWSDGEKFEGQFINNKRNGYGKYYNANGNLIEQGNYVAGELK